jgi:DegV family protein with EDD domain
VVTDSTSNIPDNLLQKHHISVLPQVLIWGEQTFRDGVDIQPDEFYTRLKTTKVMPTTSQATIGAFQEVFSRLATEGYDILAVLVGEKLSGTLDSARQAMAMVPEARVELVDSGSAAMALGFQVLAAARAAGEGADLDECKEIAEEAAQHTGVIFAVDTLEFLHRGGRIGGGARFLGTALNIKPILELRGGRVEAVERVRTRRKSLQRVIDLADQRIAGRQPVRLAVLHANAPEEAKILMEEAKYCMDPIESFYSQVSPVVGTHTGPGTVGLAFMAGM